MYVLSGKGMSERLLCRPAWLAYPDLFDRLWKEPSTSVNFITAHDGFTLNDLVTYNEKHNEANGEGNRDGSSDNRSWNCGVEGPTDDPVVNRLKIPIAQFLGHAAVGPGYADAIGRRRVWPNPERQQRCLLSRQRISWLNWNITEKGKSLIQFVKQLAHLRHKYPILRRNRFLTGQYVEEVGVKDVTWITPTAAK